jgi:4-hydroxymandelate oxidase
VGQIESRWFQGRSRREALRALGMLLAGSPLLGAQKDPHPLSAHKRMPGLDEMVTAFDFEPIFYANVPLAMFDFTAHGDGSEFTTRRNREAFDWVDIVPKKPVPVSSVNLATEVLGLKMDSPIFVAPTGMQLQLHPDAENAMYKGATAARVPVIWSNNTNVPIDKLATAANGPMWFQLYPDQDLKRSRKTLEDAQAAGCTAVVVTIDNQANAFERDLHDRNLGGNPRPVGRGHAAVNTRYPISYRRLWYNWQYIHDIRPFIKGPMIIKGILTPEDAELCIQHGVDGIIVSNHGGRSLDYDPASLEVLPEIIDVVRGRIPVLTDSGYRRGSDALKALALGANAVCLGRTTRWALAAFGASGVQRLLEIFQSELKQAMADAGRPSVASLDRTAVRTHFL